MRYEPGTVAVIDVDFGQQGTTDQTAFRIDSDVRREWCLSNGALVTDLQAKNVRPLVVLDLKGWPDAAQLLRATVEAQDERGMHDVLYAEIADQVEAQTSAKPDEPTGLGAVVRDRDGDTWVRCRGQNQGFQGVTWEHSHTGGHRPYVDIEAAEVLSPGLQPTRAYRGVAGS